MTPSLRLVLRRWFTQILFSVLLSCVLAQVESDNPLQLGLSTLDEPAAKQSDPSIMELQLRSLTKTAGGRVASVKRVACVERELKVVDKWIQDIEELHRAAPAPSLQYTKPMPGVDALLAVWPHQLQTLLSQATLPSAALEVSLESYVDLLCCMLDIPVYKSRIQVGHTTTGTPLILTIKIFAGIACTFHTVLRIQQFRTFLQ